MAAANLADRYISDRFLPDKAIDLIDEAGSRLRIKRMKTPPDLRELERKLDEVQEANVADFGRRAVRRPRPEESGARPRGRAGRARTRGTLTEELRAENDAPA